MGALTAFRSLPLARQLTAMLAVIATIVALTFLTKQTMKPRLDLLYSGLDGQVAGEVVAELAAKNVIYEVRGNAIYAEAGRRDALRMELAKDGLPRQAMSGYELFDDVNSFAMTSDMFNTAYWRAKEGELGRTILGLPGINKARVHLGTAKRASFSATPAAQSASVTISTVSGLNAQTAKAIQYLTALAVAGLTAQDVVVIDARLGIVAGPGSANAAMSSRTAGMTDEIDRAASIKQNLLSILEARVGSGNARVSVTLDVNRKRESMVERTFDPSTRVIKSQTVSEVTDTSSGQGSGPVTIASSLPDGDGEGGSSSNASRGETTETTQYEISELVRNTEILPGEIKRMTVAILVSDIVDVAADGTVTTTTRPADELQALRELALAAAGINIDKGDVLTMKSFPFQRPDLTGAVEAPGLFQEFLQKYLWSMVQAGFLGLVTLILGLFVVRPLFTQKPLEAEGGLLPMELMSTGAIEAAQAGQAGLPAPDGAAGSTIDPNIDPIDMLKQVTGENPNEAAALLGSWLDGREDTSLPAPTS